MRHRKKKKILDRKKSARKALLKNLAASLIIHEKIQTTSAKAKTLRPYIEKLITLAKKNNLTARRQLRKYLFTQEAIKKILEDIANRYQNRKGGYTRIIKIKRRPGDASEIVQIEFIKSA